MRYHLKHFLLDRQVLAFKRVINERHDIWSLLISFLRLRQQMRRTFSEDSRDSLLLKEGEMFKQSYRLISVPPASCRFDILSIF